MSGKGAREQRDLGFLTIAPLAAISILLGCARVYGRTPADTQPADIQSSSVPEPESETCPTTLDVRHPLSLAQAVDLALCNNADIRVAWANIRVQAAAVGGARSAYWPDLSASVSGLNERAGYPGSGVPATNTTGKTVYGSFDWRLFDFGGRSARYHAAESLLEAAVASRDATIQEVLGAVVQAYFDAITAKAVLADRVQSEAAANETLASAQRRQTAGAAAQNDTLQAKAAVERATLDRNRADGDERKARAVLAYEIGIPAAANIRLPDDLDARSMSEQKDLADWMSRAERQHPAITAARAAVRAAQDDVVSARSEGRPTIDLTANYYQNGFPNQGFSGTNVRAATVGLTVTVPLFDGFLTHYHIEQARAAVRVREGQLQDTRQATLLAVIRAYTDAQSALRNIDVSEDLLNAAQAAFASSQRRYSQGAADIVELLNAQTALADSRTERTRSLAAWRSARLRLLASAGVLGRADVRD